MTDLDSARQRVRERVASLPDGVRDCERCGGDGAMQIRRSSLNSGYRADDVMLKCDACRYVATHGIPFTDPDQFDAEMELREGRVLDFADDGPNSRRENLAALGYLAEASTEG